MSEVVWITRDGRRLTMAQITDKHLLNIHRYLIRTGLDALSEGYAAMSFLQGEMAIEAAEAEVHHLHREYVAAAEVFRVEIERRGLRPLPE